MQLAIALLATAIVVVLYYWNEKASAFRQGRAHEGALFWWMGGYYNSYGEEVARIQRSVFDGVWLIDYYVIPQMDAKFWDSRAEVRHSVETFVRDVLPQMVRAQATTAAVQA